MMPQILPIRPSDYPAVRTTLLESVDLYPGIDQWWSKKVVPELSGGRRFAYVIAIGEQIGGIAIGKTGEEAKLCSLRVEPAWRDKGMGRALMSQTVAHLKVSGARAVHVTMSESVAADYEHFFEAAGFTFTDSVSGKYVSGTDEFVYRASIGQLCSAIQGGDSDVTQLPLWSSCSGNEQPTLMFSVKPEYGKLILEGDKKVEFRKRFSKKHIGSVALFYLSQPVGEAAFTATIADVSRGPTKRLWARFGDKGGVDKDTFDNYFTGKRTGYAIELDHVQPLEKPLSLQCLRDLGSSLEPPQSYKMLDSGADWLHAVQGVAQA